MEVLCLKCLEKPKFICIPQLRVYCCQSYILMLTYIHFHVYIYSTHKQIETTMQYLAGDLARL